MHGVIHVDYERYEIEDDHVTVGPWGNQNEARWDDGVFSSVRQVVISYGAGIDSILIEYDKKGWGCSVWSDKHDGSVGFKTNSRTIKMFEFLPLTRPAPPRPFC